MKKEKLAALLLDHHKDTFQIILYHWKVRNRLFLFILILLALMGYYQLSLRTRAKSRLEGRK